MMRASAPAGWREHPAAARVPAREPLERHVTPPSRPVLMTADAVGGVWRYSIDLAAALRARGLCTTIAVMGPPPKAAQRREAEAAEVALVDRPYRLEWMEDPWADVERAGRWLLALARALRPAVVHLNGYAHAQLDWPCPVVVVAHSCVRTWWKAIKREQAPDRLARYTRAVASGLGAAHAVVAPTAALLRALEDEYGVTMRARVIANGASCSAAAPPLATKEAFVLSAGRVWDEAKNIQAVAAIANQLNWPVFVAGECREPGGSQSVLCDVRLLGSLSGQDLAGWYRRAGIYVLPARYEPFGLSVLEAANAACALVLGDIPTLRESWDGAALFVAPDDHRALLGAIQRLIDAPALRADLGQRAFARASTFSLDRTADEYLRLYDSLIS